MVVRVRGQPVQAFFVDREGEMEGVKSSDGSREEGTTAEKQEVLLGSSIKLKRGGILVGKKSGPSTPSPKWKLSSSSHTSTSASDIEEVEEEKKKKKKKNTQVNNNNFTIKASLTLPSTSTTTVSARKLGANFWEIEQFSIAKMHRVKDVKLRVHHKEKGPPPDLPSHSIDPPQPQPASTSSLGRHVEESVMQHHQSVAKNGFVLQPVSPSYGSSMEVAAYNPPITPTSSLDLNRRVGESGHSLKTSTELLKVLNRIWTLEEQHASNVSLVKTLKVELDHSRAQIRGLLKEQQSDRRQIDDLLKQVAQGNLGRKNKEQDCIIAAVQSMRDELEDERKLRKKSESLHRKLARELSEVKTAFSKALKELERERKAQTLLEELCDEFARGIGEYEQEVRALKQKSENEDSCRDDHNGMIIHISDAWLDERMQMKLADARFDFVERNTIVERLSFEIEAFLQARRSIRSKDNGLLLSKDTQKDSCLNRHSQESVHLHEAGSAPQHVGDEEDSTDSDSQCFEINKGMGDKESSGCPTTHGDEALEDHQLETMKSNPTKKRYGSRERNNSRNLSGLQLQFAEQMAWAMSSNGNTNQLLEKEHSQVRTKDANSVEISNSQKSKHYEATQDCNHEGKGKRDGSHGSNSNHVVDNLIRNQILLSDGRKSLPKNKGSEDSCGNSAWRGHSSPVQQWKTRFASPDIEISESSSKWAGDFQENTLKAKLLEARIEGQHSRLKSSRGFKKL